MTDTNIIKNTLPAEQPAAEAVRWLRFLPRWSLLVGLATLTLPIVFVVGIGQQDSDDALGAIFVELLQAVRSPGMFRLGWTLDAIVWLLIGGSLLTLAGTLRRHAPVRGGFIAACGVAQVIGAAASLLRLNGIGDLAGLYAAAATAEQALYLSAHLNLWRVINALNHTGVLLQGTGFLLAAWAAFSLRGFPRWLAAWLALPGILSVVQFVLVAAGAPFWRPLNILGLVGNIALNFAMAVSLWRPSSTLVSAVAGESAG